MPFTSEKTSLSRSRTFSTISCSFSIFKVSAIVEIGYFTEIMQGFNAHSGKNLKNLKGNLKNLKDTHKNS